MRPAFDAEYLIVGQGLAGSLLAWRLLRAGKEVKVVDDASPRAASRVAAGIVNPVTGRHYVRSWRYDELRAEAWRCYREIEEDLGIQLLEERPILRTLLNAGDENKWWSRAQDPAYRAYLAPEVDLGNYRNVLQPAFGHGEVAHSGRVRIGTLVENMGQRLRQAGRLMQEAFDHADLRPAIPSGWAYRGRRFGKVIFCEGYNGKFNPYFSFLPFRGAKGEVLLVKIPGAGFRRILKRRVFIVPLGADRYWIGATMENEFSHSGPTGAGKKYLEEELKKTIRLPFALEEQRSGVRPTVRDRRPLLGEHPHHSGLFIFNGLGSKGASLGPLFSGQMLRLLLEGQPPEPEVDIRRFRQMTVS